MSTFFLRKSMRTKGKGQVASGFCPHQVMSYNALAAVLDLLVETRSRPCPEALQAAAQSHLHHRLAAYGAAAFPPKAHYSHHLADQLRRHGALVSLWTHERKHEELKKWANQSHNASKGSSWERGLLEEVVSKGDVVSFQVNAELAVGQVWFHAQAGPNLLTCLSGWRPEARHVFDMNDDPCWVETGSIVEWKAYKVVHGRKATVMA